MENINILLQRRTIRNFKDKPIKIELLKQVISDAQRAPSYENSQPWKLYIATGKSLENIRLAHQDEIKSKQRSYNEVPSPQDWNSFSKLNVNKYYNEMKSILDTTGVENLFSTNAALFKAPVIIYITMPKESTHYSSFDVGAFSFGVLLSAMHHGLGAVPAFETIRFPNEIRNQFEIPEDESILIGIAIGYPSCNGSLDKLVMSRANVDQIIQYKN